MSQPIDEFLSAMKSRGAIVSAPAPHNALMLANIALQNMRAAMLPKFMIDLYGASGAINLGSGYIFGPTEVSRGARYPIPDIVNINRELAGNPRLRGLTVFGRNDLFWFAFDSFGTCVMLDNLNLSVLRKYDDGVRAMQDCLIAGKI